MRTFMCVQFILGIHCLADVDNRSASYSSVQAFYWHKNCYKKLSVLTPLWVTLLDLNYLSVDGHAHQQSETRSQQVEHKHAVLEC